jgi:hypothetical protein
MNMHRPVVFVVICLAVSLAACSTQQPAQSSEKAQASQPAPPPQPLASSAPTQSAIGQLQDVNLTDKTLTIKNTEGNSETFSFTETTEIVGTSDAQGLSTQRGSQVAVTFAEQDGRKMAQRVEIGKK